MSRWPSGSPKLTVPHQDDGEVVVEPWNSTHATDVIDLQAEEGRMPVEQSSDQYMNKLVQKVRQGLKPDFDAVNVRIDGLTSNVVGLTADVAGLTTNVADLTTNVADQAKANTSRFNALDQCLGTLDESLNAIKKHLGI